MYIQINKEGRERYKRKYFFPKEKDDWYGIKTVDIHTSWYRDYKVASISQDELSILCYCPSCGFQFYGAWHHNEKFAIVDDLDPKYFLCKEKMTLGEASKLAKKETAAYQPTKAKIDSEIREFKSMHNCPLCGGKIKTERKNNCTVYDIDFTMLCKNTSGKNADPNDNISTAKSSAVSTEFNIDASKIADNVSLLQKYIKQLLDTEVTVQLLQSRLKELCRSANSYKKSYTDEHLEEMSVLAVAEYWRRKDDNLLTIDDAVVEDTRPPKPLFTAKEPAPPIFVNVGFFNKKKALADNEALQAEYDAKCRRYQEEKEAYDNALKEWKAADARYKKAKQSALEKLQTEYEARKEAELRAFSEGLKESKLEILHQIPDYALYQETIGEISKTEKLLAQAYGCLKSLYSCGVIYEKYRDPVSLASFYDYFASGRCTTLTGPNGAYNLYESEIRMDLIIAKLDVVITKLEDIKKNQYMLYSVMADMNAELKSLNKTAAAMESSIREMKGRVATIEKNSEVIAHNTAVTAFYAKKTAELTDALGFMMALK